MTPAEVDLVDLIITGAKDKWDELNDFEQDFMTSIEEKRTEWGDRMRVSYKQWAVLHRLYDKVVGC